jgi:hypothetical protein
MSDPNPADLAAALLDAARRAGAETADAIVIAGTSVSVDVRGGTLEQADRAEGLDLGLRVLIGRRQACVSASDASPARWRGWPNAPWPWPAKRPRTPGRAWPIPRSWPRRDAAGLELFDPAAEPAPEALLEDARRAEAAALAVAWGSAGSTRPRPAMAARDVHWRPQRLFRRLSAHRALDLLRGDHRRGHGDGARLVERIAHLRRRSARRPEMIGSARPANAPPPAPARASRPRAPFRCSMTNASLAR